MYMPVIYRTRAACGTAALTGEGWRRTEAPLERADAMPSEERPTAETERDANAAASLPTCRLYLISPERIDHPALFADELRSALDGGDVAAFQLRLKGVEDGAIARVADTL